MTAKISTVKWIPIEERSRRCQAKRLGVYLNDREGCSYRCKLRASVEFDGIALCKRHAGMAALEMLAGPEPKPPELRLID